jgi:hypothetical protein
MNAGKLTSNLLVCFVLVSIGFALGKETALHSARESGPAATRDADAGEDLPAHSAMVYQGKPSGRLIVGIEPASDAA